MSDPLSERIAALVDLADLALQFGQVERITYHPDCKTRESDTTHTVMLIWAACSLQPLLAPTLSPGLVAQFAAVHDAPEALCGDTQTLKISAEERASKDAREAEASREIHKRFASSLP